MSNTFRLLSSLHVCCFQNRDFAFSGCILQTYHWVSVSVTVGNKQYSTILNHEIRPWRCRKRCPKHFLWKGHSTDRRPASSCHGDATLYLLICACADTQLVDSQLGSAEFCLFSHSARLTKTSILSTSDMEDFTGLPRLLLLNPPPLLSLSFSTGMLLFIETTTTRDTWAQLVIGQNPPSHYFWQHYNCPYFFNLFTNNLNITWSVCFQHF